MKWWEKLLWKSSFVRHWANYFYEIEKTKNQLNEGEKK